MYTPVHGRRLAVAPAWQTSSCAGIHSVQSSTPGTSVKFTVKEAPYKCLYNIKTMKQTLSSYKSCQRWSFILWKVTDYWLSLSLSIPMYLYSISIQRSKTWTAREWGNNWKFDYLIKLSPGCVQICIGFKPCLTCNNSETKYKLKQDYDTDAL